jgi:hypothetical protein
VKVKLTANGSDGQESFAIMSSLTGQTKPARANADQNLGLFVAARIIGGNLSEFHLRVRTTVAFRANIDLGLRVARLFPLYSFRTPLRTVGGNARREVC